MTLQLSVLDQSPVRSGATPADAVAETVQLAQAADRLGFARYWLAEHHATDGLAGSSPEIMIARVAAATRAIRVGSGGVMLSHYSPLKVAENFKLLETMFPGRIDCGIGRAPGSDGLTAAALAYGSQIGIEYFPAKVADLRGFLTDTRPLTEAFARVKATPRVPQAPDLWLLGSSDSSAALAARFGIAFSFAHFINGEGGEQIVNFYRHAYEASEFAPAPRANICLFAICAETEEKARYLAKSRDLWRVQLERGRLGPYPSPEEAEAYPYTPEERARMEQRSQSHVIGTPDMVKAGIQKYADSYGVDEVMVLTICHDFRARVRSYELIAEAFGLTARW